MGVRRVIARAAFVPRALAYLFARRQLTVGGYALCLDFTDNGSFRYQRCHGRRAESYESSLMKAFLGIISANPGSVVLDIGASYGTYSLAAASIGRYGLVRRVVAFEPDSRCHSALQRSIAANELDDLVSGLHVVAGDYSGEARLLLSERASTSNRTFDSGTDTMGFTNSVTVPCVKVDDVLAEHVDVTNQPLIVKIDVEGNELRVLQGMRRTLTKASGFNLQIEYMPLAIREVGLTTAAMRGFLKDLGLEYAFLEGPDGLLQFESIGALWEHMRSLEHVRDPRYGGIGCNYIVGRRMNISAMSGAPVSFATTRRHALRIAA